MSLNDFYVGTTKKFDVNFTVQNVAPNISTDTVTVLFYNSGSGLIYTSSADCTTSGSTGTAMFNITDDVTTLWSPDIYEYQIEWAVSASSENYVVDVGQVNIIRQIGS